jgi:DNA-binding LacI/PurR family transcriptional regulator
MNDFFNKGSKITIAYLGRGIDNDIGLEIKTGVINAALENNINLYIFDGNKLGEGIQNVAYELINKNQIQGILTWASSDYDEYIKFYDRFPNIPLVGLTLQIKKNPYISIDSYYGMKELITHLVEVHNYKKIAFIRGPENHIYAKERYQAYLDTLKSFDIPINNDLITPPLKWSNEDGKKAIKFFLDEKKLKLKQDIEVIVSVSDPVIIGAHLELRNRKIRVPQDVAITGYNCSIEGETITPPITSVKMPFKHQGEQGVKMLLDLINGKTVENHIKLDSKLDVKQSCGCESVALQLAAVVVDNDFCKSSVRKAIKEKLTKKDIEKENISFEDFRQKSAADMNETVLKYLGESVSSPDFIEELMNKLLDSFVDDLKENGQKSFIQAFDEILLSISEKEGNLLAWQGAISILRQNVLDMTKTKSGKILNAESLIGQARVLISEIISRTYMSINLQNDKKAHLVRDFTSLLITTFNITELTDLLTNWLPKFEISTFFLSLFDNPGEYKFLETPVPEYSRLIYCLRNDIQETLPATGVKFKTIELLPSSYFKDGESSYNFIIEPLYFKDKILGFIIVKNGSSDKSINSVLRNVISSCLQGALLLEQREKTEIFLEETLDNLQTKAKIVTSNTKQINERIDDISAAMEEVAVNAQEVSQRISEVMDTVNMAVLNAKDANQILENLKANSKKVSEITKIISDIAQRTNILSLNANIEAARSGEYGKGFKVVAKEIKRLAQETVTQADVINKTIALMGISTTDSVDVINNIIDIVDKISVTASIMKEAIAQQAEASRDVSRKLIEASSGTKEIYNAIKEVSVDEAHSNDTEIQTEKETIANKLKHLKDT